MTNTTNFVKKCGSRPKLDRAFVRQALVGMPEEDERIRVWDEICSRS